MTWPRRDFPWKGCAHAQPGSCAITALVGPFDQKWRYEASSVVTLTPKGVPLGEVRTCTNESCTISALAGPFHRKCPFGCSLVRPYPMSSMATGTSPFTGYLPLSCHFISTFNNGFHLRCFRKCCVVLQVVCSFLLFFFMNFLSITTFLDSFLQFSCLFNILITILLTCCSFVIDVYVNVWYFHNVFRFVFVCNMFWVEFQLYGCCCCWSGLNMYCCCSSGGGSGRGGGCCCSGVNVYGCCCGVYPSVSGGGGGYTLFSSVFSISIRLAFLPYFSYLFTIQLPFLPYYPYLITIQLAFLPHFPYLFTIQPTFLPYFSYLFTIQLGFLLYFPYHFTIQPTFLPYFQGSSLTFWPTCPFGQVPYWFYLPETVNY